MWIMVMCFNNYGLTYTWFMIDIQLIYTWFVVMCFKNYGLTYGLWSSHSIDYKLIYYMLTMVICLDNCD